MKTWSLASLSVQENMLNIFTDFSDICLGGVLGVAIIDLFLFHADETWMWQCAGPTQIESGKLTLHWLWQCGVLNRVLVNSSLHKSIYFGGSV